MFGLKSRRFFSSNFKSRVFTKALIGWALLSIFAFGTYVSISHQHTSSNNTENNQILKKNCRSILYQKCYYCDIIGHSTMALSVEVKLFVGTIRLDKILTYSISLNRNNRFCIPGRAPPIV